MSDNYFKNHPNKENICDKYLSGSVVPHAIKKRRSEIAREGACSEERRLRGFNPLGTSLLLSGTGAP